VYTLHKKGELVEQRLVTVVFRGDVLERIEGDVVAGAKAAPPAESKAPTAATEKK
jgi:hypothetical protein